MPNFVLLLSVFGILVTVILDWYHLKKKVNEYMSMFGLPLSEKKAKIKEILHCLWRGKVDEAMGKIEEHELPEMRMKWKQGLLGYLEKHRAEIINYEERKRLGKFIGSGRVESGVNQVVGERQKHNGMSWSRSGSKSLGILKAVQLNDQWNELFCSERLAA